MGLIITLALIVFLVIGIKLLNRWEWEGTGIIITTTSAMLLALHLILFLTVRYNYAIFKVKRDSFEMSISNCRLDGNEMECAAILKEVSLSNIELSSYKFHNSIPFIGIYVDNRFDNLEPIK
jgi:hypothetical protein